MSLLDQFRVNPVDSPGRPINTMNSMHGMNRGPPPPSGNNFQQGREGPHPRYIPNSGPNPPGQAMPGNGSFPPNMSMRGNNMPPPPQGRGRTPPPGRGFPSPSFPPPGRGAPVHQGMGQFPQPTPGRRMPPSLMSTTNSLPPNRTLQTPQHQSHQQHQRPFPAFEENMQFPPHAPYASNPPQSQEKIPCIISWPVLQYVDGQFMFQILFMRKNHLVTIHPLTSEVITYRPIDTILRVSYDTSEHDNSTFSYDESEDMSAFKLFRVIFKKKIGGGYGFGGQTTGSSNYPFGTQNHMNHPSKRKNDIFIFFSKDGNEIVNAIASKMNQIRAKQDGYGFERRIEGEAPAPLNTFPSSPRSEHRETIHSPQSPQSPDSDGEREGSSLTPYRYTIHSGLYQYQVFGVDRHGKLYPHSISLFSHFIKHVDTRTRRTFAQHIYEHIVTVDMLENNRIQIKYAYDNPYTFICSDQDRTELFCLLKGRVAIYQLLKTNLGVDPFDDVSSYASQDSPRSDRRGHNLDFPTSFSYEDERIANEDPYRHDPEMLTALLKMGSRPLDNLNLDEQENDSISLGVDDVDISLHLNNVQLGMEVWKAKKVTSKKASSMKKIFLRFEKDCIALWGSKRSKLKYKAKIKEMITGEEAQFQQSKANKDYSFVLKAENEKDDLYCVARDQNEYKSWTLAIEFFLKGNSD